MSRVTFDYSKAKTFISEHEIESMKKIAENAKAELLGKEGAGNDFLGWIDLPVDYDKEEFARIKESVLEALILAQGRRLNSCVTISITWYRRKYARHRRSISWATASAAPT